MSDDQALTDLFRQVTDGRSTFTRRMAITLADIFGMSPMAMVDRLERMSLVKSGTTQWFRNNGGITRAHVRTVRIETRQALRHRGRALP